MKFEQEALKYNLDSLIKLQNKRIDNIILFEQSIMKEKKSINMEEAVQTALESKIKLHELGDITLNDTEYYLISLDLPKIKSTIKKRAQTIVLLENAIVEERIAMDYEKNMITFLESHDGKK